METYKIIFKDVFRWSSNRQTEINWRGNNKEIRLKIRDSVVFVSLLKKKETWKLL